VSLGSTRVGTWRCACAAAGAFLGCVCAGTNGAVGVCGEACAVARAFVGCVRMAECAVVVSVNGTKGGRSGKKS
jgi:uncharacterized membrane protein